MHAWVIQVLPSFGGRPHLLSDPSFRSGYRVLTSSSRSVAVMNSSAMNCLISIIGVVANVSVWHADALRRTCGLVTRAAREAMTIGREPSSLASCCCIIVNGSLRESDLHFSVVVV